MGDNDDEGRGFVSASNDREKKQSRQLHTRKLEYTLLKNNLHFLKMKHERSFGKMEDFLKRAFAVTKRL